MSESGLVVVADSSPLIALARIDQLELLPALYQRVTVPEAVWREVTRGASEHRAGAAEVQRAPWIDIRHVDPQDAAAHEVLVDRGEAEAIALASRTQAKLLLIDDARGRQLALRLGLQIKGTLGILVSAKQQKLIPEIRPNLDRLRASGLHVSAPSCRTSTRSSRRSSSRRVTLRKRTHFTRKRVSELIQGRATISR